MSEEQIFVKALENIIDARFKYLKELEFENHSYASKILEKEYNPALEELLKVVKKDLTFSTNRI